MGFRVHRFLGYGLNDLVHDTDPRINWDSPLVKGMNNELTIDLYREFLERKDAEPEDPEDLTQRRKFRSERAFIRWHKDEVSGPLKPVNCMVMSSSEDLGEHLPVMVLRPVTDNDWCRYDDMIDWMQETYLEGDVSSNGDSRVDLFKGGIFPYNTYMDKRTGEPLNSEVFTWLRASRYTEYQPGEPYSGEVSIGDLDEIASFFGFASHQEAWDNVVPMVPIAIHDLVEFGELFTNSRVVLELRPMLFTYWR